MTTPSISVQLYSVNAPLNADLDDGLSKLAPFAAAQQLGLETVIDRRRWR